MAPRKKRKTPRRRMGFSIINAAESLAYANIMTQGLFNSNVAEFVFGSKVVPGGYEGGMGLGVVGGYGGSAYGITELINDPNLFSNVAANAQRNAYPMAIQAATVGVGFRLFKRLLRRPISNVNRNIFTPLLGKGVVRL
jgi:hypothetical protein